MGNEENRVEDVNVLTAGILEHSPNQTLTAEGQRGQINKVSLRSLLAMSDMISPQGIWKQVIKVIRVHCGKYMKFRKL